jgi:hypothetical protein
MIAYDSSEEHAGLIKPGVGVLLTFLMTGLLAYPASASNLWDVAVVDISEGGYSSLAILPSGQPAISYSHAGDNDLKYAWYDGAIWRTVNVDNGYIRDTSLAILPSGEPAIAYYDQDSYDLKYAWCDDGAWQTVTVDQDEEVGSSVCLAILPSGLPVISYRDSTNEDLKYAWYDGSTWQTTAVDTQGNVGYYTSLAILPSGDPAISYYDGTNDNLKYAWYDGDVWYTTTVDSEGSVGMYTGLTILPSGRPAISYIDSTNDIVKYAWYDGSTWQLTAVDTTSAEFYVYTSLATQPSGYPAISYKLYPDSGDPLLKYAWYDGSTWRTSTVQTAISSVDSLVILPSGKPGISYSDAECLKFTTPAISPAPVTMEVSYTATAWTEYGGTTVVEDGPAYSDGLFGYDTPAWTESFVNLEVAYGGHLQGVIALAGADGEQCLIEECVEWDPMDPEICLYWECFEWGPVSTGNANGMVAGTITLGTSERYSAGSFLELFLGLRTAGIAGDAEDYHLQIWRGGSLLAQIDSSAPHGFVVSVQAGETLTFELFSSQEDLYDDGESYNHDLELRMILLPPAISADIDRNAFVNFADLEFLFNQWLQPPSIPSADIAPDNGDGIVNFWDFAVVAQSWLAGPDLDLENAVKFHSIEPEDLVIGEQTLITFTAEVATNPLLSSVSLLRLSEPVTDVSLLFLDKNNQPAATIGYLHDDGLDGDEHKGDNIYTLQLTLSEPAPSRMVGFQVAADYYYSSAPLQVRSEIEALDVYRFLTEEEANSISYSLDEGWRKYNQWKEEYSEQYAKDNLINWLKSLDGIVDAGVSQYDEHLVWIDYECGLTSHISIGPEDIRGGASPPEQESYSPVVMPGNTNAIVLGIGDANAYRECRYVADKLSGIYNQDQTFLLSYEVTIDVLRGLDQYGIIYFATHGGISKRRNHLLLTAEYWDPNYPNKYAADLFLHRLELSKTKAICITPSFILRHCKQWSFPDSLVYIAACDSVYEPNDPNDPCDNFISWNKLFLDKGAYNYCGYTGMVHGEFVGEVTRGFFDKLVDKSMTTGQAYSSLPRIKDPNNPNTGSFKIVHKDGDENNLILLTPLIEPVYPLEGSTIVDNEPPIQAKVYTPYYEGNPNAIPIELESIEVTLTDHLGDQVPGTLNYEPYVNDPAIIVTYTPDSALEADDPTTLSINEGKYTVTVEGGNINGLAAEPNTWDFYVTTPIPRVVILSDEEWMEDYGGGMWYSDYEADYYTYLTNTVEEDPNYGNLEDDRHLHSSVLSGSIRTADNEYFWGYVTWGYYPDSYHSIYGKPWETGGEKSIKFHDGLYYSSIYGIFSDGTYLWVIAKDHGILPEHTDDYRVYRVTIQDMSYEQVGTIPHPGGDYTGPNILSMDATYFYVMYSYTGDYGINPGSHKRIDKIKKSDFTIESFTNISTQDHQSTVDNPHNTFDRYSWECTINPQPRQCPWEPFTLYREDWTTFGCSDDQYIYLRREVRYETWGEVGEEYYECFAQECCWFQDWGIQDSGIIVDEIIKLSKEDLSIISFLSTQSITGPNIFLQDATANKDFVFFLCSNFFQVDKRSNPEPILTGHLKIYDKQGQLIKTYNQDIGGFSFDKYEETYDNQNLDILSFHLSISTSDQGWFGMKPPKHLQGN